jgi:hypothetical protein
VRHQLRDELSRLVLGPVEEPGKHLGAVLRREDLRDLEDCGEAKASVPEWLDDLGDALDQRGRGRTVGGGALRQPELPVQEHEQARVAELLPCPSAIEVGEREEKLRHRFVLTAEEIGEAGREVACVHERSFARDFSGS